jgi:hypothetical protein
MQLGAFGPAHVCGVYVCMGYRWGEEILTKNDRRMFWVMSILHQFFTSQTCLTSDATPLLEEPVAFVVHTCLGFFVDNCCVVRVCAHDTVFVPGRQSA